MVGNLKRSKFCDWCSAELVGRQKIYCSYECRYKSLKHIEVVGISKERKELRKEKAIKIRDLAEALDQSRYDDAILTDAALLPRWKVVKSDNADGIYEVLTPVDLNFVDRTPKTGDGAWLIQFLVDNWLPKAKVFLVKKKLGLGDKA